MAALIPTNHNEQKAANLFVVDFVVRTVFSLKKKSSKLTKHISNKLQKEYIFAMHKNNIIRKLIILLNRHFVACSLFNTGWLSIYYMVILHYKVKPMIIKKHLMFYWVYHYWPWPFSINGLSGTAVSNFNYIDQNREHWTTMQLQQNITICITKLVKRVDRNKTYHHSSQTIVRHLNT